MSKLAALALASSLLYCGASLNAHANTNSNTFAISATLLNPASTTGPISSSLGCVSQAFSLATNATVRVVCGGNQFVSIEPTPGRAFLGTHGAAFRFAFGPGLASPPAQVSNRNSDSNGFNNSDNKFLIANPYVGVGTVTSLRVINLSGFLDLFEFLVSF